MRVQLPCTTFYLLPGDPLRGEASPAAGTGWRATLLLPGLVELTDLLIQLPERIQRTVEELLKLGMTLEHRVIIEDRVQVTLCHMNPIDT